MKWSEAYEHSGRTIAVPVKLIHAIGAKGAILVSQLYWWKDKGRDPDGWIYKTKKELTEETGISLKEQRKCVADLKKNGILETRYDRLGHHLLYRIHLESLDAIMEGSLPGEVPFRHVPKRPVAQAQKADGISPEGRSLYRSGKTQEKTQEKTKSVVIVPFAREEDSERDIVDKLAEEFGLSASQSRSIEAYPIECLLEKAEIVRSEPRKNAAKAFIAALRDDWKPAKQIAKEKADRRHESIRELIEVPTNEDWERRRASLAKLKATL